MKELFIEAQEQMKAEKAESLVALGWDEDTAWRFAEQWADEPEACDEALDRSNDAWADFADRARDMAKERQLESYREGGAI